LRGSDEGSDEAMTAETKTATAGRETRREWQMHPEKQAIDVIMWLLLAGTAWAIAYVAVGWAPFVGRGLRVLGALWVLWAALFLRRVRVPEEGA